MIGNIFLGICPRIIFAIQVNIVFQSLFLVPKDVFQFAATHNARCVIDCGQESLVGRKGWSLKSFSSSRTNGNLKVPRPGRMVDERRRETQCHQAMFAFFFFDGESRDPYATRFICFRYSSFELTCLYQAWRERFARSTGSQKFDIWATLDQRKAQQKPKVYERQARITPSNFPDKFALSK
jgi:hypothetical protein